MKILILGASGITGSIIYKYYIRKKKYKIIAQTSNSSHNSNFRYYKVNLKSNLNKLLKLIQSENFDIIFNCLFIRDKDGKYDNSVPIKIIKSLNTNNIYNTKWIEMSSYSILLRNKTEYSKKKYQFEILLKKKYSIKLDNLKIIRISNFANINFLKKFSFFTLFNTILIPSNPNNTICISSEKNINRFLDNFLKSKKIKFALFSCMTLIEFSNFYFKEKSTFFLNLNINLFTNIKYFLSKYQKDRLSNFLNLFYSKH